MGMRGNHECASRTQHLQVLVHWDLFTPLVLSELSERVRDQVSFPLACIL